MNALATEQLSDAGPRLVFIHGFTQTRESWRPVAARFVHDHEVVLVDAPYHGESTNVEVDLLGASQMIGTVVNGGVCVGYSMGGRMALLAALNDPGHIGALVLVSTTAGIDDPDERHSRREADAALAAEIERCGTQSFLDSWLAQPMFSHLSIGELDLEARLHNSPTALARSLRRCGTGNQEPVWQRLAELTMPILIVSGEEDRKFTEIAYRLNAALPQAQLKVIEGAGHSPHLEQPQVFVTVIREWMTEIGC